MYLYASPTYEKKKNNPPQMLEGANDFQSKVIYCLSILDILVFSEHL